jgi:hypothetical protein
LGYALPFLIVPILTVILGERSRPILAAINDKVTKVSVVIMPAMLGLVGLAFIADAAYYFSSGKGLF